MQVDIAMNQENSRTLHPAMFILNGFMQLIPSFVVHIGIDSSATIHKFHQYYAMIHEISQYYALYDSDASAMAFLAVKVCWDFSVYRWIKYCPFSID